MERKLGINTHGLNFLVYANKFQDFGDTVTIGRQGLHVKDSTVRKILSIGLDYKNDDYAEKIMKIYFKAGRVDSIDNSNYEGASIIHDMNYKLPLNYTSIYGTIIDGGCLEHIFNISQALMNCSLLCKPGGQIIHILPANNFCGHGFYQISPELFFSLYSQDNGYRDTEVYLAASSNTKFWYKVKPPKNGKRVIVYSSSEIHVLVRTVLNDSYFAQINVQQSDYIHEWKNHTKEIERKFIIKNFLRNYIVKSPKLYAILFPIYRYYLYNFKLRLNRFNPGLIKINVKSLLK
jgi:hypothetical protein